jgi:hypothetical protein
MTAQEVTRSGYHVAEENRRKRVEDQRFNAVEAISATDTALLEEFGQPDPEAPAQREEEPDGKEPDANELLAKLLEAVQTLNEVREMVERLEETVGKNQEAVVAQFAAVHQAIENIDTKARVT